MKNGKAPESTGSQKLVSRLQSHIADTFYLCTNEISEGLGQIVFSDYV